MKPSSRMSRLLTRKRPARVTPDGNPGASELTPPRPWLPHWVVPLLCVTVAAVATFALFEYLILSKVPRAMLGKWVVVEGEMEGATLEFFRDGRMLAKVNMQGKEGVIKAQVEVDGQTMRSTTVNPFTKMEETDTQTIVTLTDTQFVIEDRKGTVMKMERAHSFRKHGSP
jgi:uncharacterized protein (TIGR03066 family)